METYAALTINHEPSGGVYDRVAVVTLDPECPFCEGAPVGCASCELGASEVEPSEDAEVYDAAVLAMGWVVKPGVGTVDVIPDVFSAWEVIRADAGGVL